MEPVGYLETGVLYCDDNLERLAQFPADCVDLIYLDPPFFSNRKYEVIWGDEAEVRSFEDRWEGGIQLYVNWMKDRMMELHRILRPTGSIYLHCDAHAVHYLKVMMDSIFGANQFRNDVIWKRKAGRGETNAAAIRFGVTVDNILFYTKSSEAKLNRQIRPSNPAYIASKFTHKEPDGRRYRRDNLTSPAPRPNLVYEYKGYNPPPNGWAVSRERMEEMDKEGRLYFPADKSKRIQRKRYLDELEGETVDNLWDDIPPINSQAAERLGWPTQKPEALLARIIKASSDRGAIVLDPFCGCGTTVAAAEQTGRQWIGIDISPTAVGLMQRRLRKLGAEPRVEGVPMTEDDLRTLKPFEFQNWVMQQISGTPSPKKSGDMGIDGLSFMYHEPIQVKQSEKVGRNVVDNFETAIERSGNERGYIVAFSFSKGAYEEAARAKAEGKAEIALVTVNDLLLTSEAITRPSAPSPPKKPTPDLMRLLTALTKTAAEQPLLPPRPRNTRPSVADLVKSDKAFH